MDPDRKVISDIFVLGDATNLSSSKAGSVAHFQVDGFVENFVRYTDGLQLLPLFDGHANCFIESGHGKGFLIDFNYDVEPLPGMFPMPRRRQMRAHWTQVSLASCTRCVIRKSGVGSQSRLKH